MHAVAVRGYLPHGANVCVAGPANQIGIIDILIVITMTFGVDCHEQ